MLQRPMTIQWHLYLSSPLMKASHRIDRLSYIEKLSLKIKARIFVNVIASFLLKPFMRIISLHKNINIAAIRVRWAVIGTKAYELAHKIN